MRPVHRRHAAGAGGVQRPQHDHCLQPTHLLAGDGRVGQHWQHLLGDRKLVLAAFGPFRQLVGQLVFRPRLPCRERLAEQLHRLIEHIDR